MKSTLLLALPSTVSSVLLLFLLFLLSHLPLLKAWRGCYAEKFNIAVTLRWLYVLTVSSLCSDNVLLSKSDSAKRRLSGRVDFSSWRIHESGEQSLSLSPPPSPHLPHPPSMSLAQHFLSPVAEIRCTSDRVLYASRGCHESSTRVIG